jgi:hypothetical protein
MKHIAFTFGTNVGSSARAETLNEIRKWDGVASATPLAAGTTNDEIARMHLVQVEDEHAAALVDRLRAMPEVASADFPSDRRLV